MLADEVVNHFCIYFILAPCPLLCNVIFVLEQNYQLMLVTGSRVGQVGGALKLKRKFPRHVLLRNGAHTRLIVRRAVVHESDPISVDAVQRQHLLHARHGKGLKDGGIGGNHLEVGLCGVAVVILPFPIPRKCLQSREGCGHNFRAGGITHESNEQGWDQRCN